MCSRDTFCIPKNTCEKGCTLKCSRCTESDETPHVLCESRYRRCRDGAPCEPMIRPCSPCRPCCNVTKPPDPIPPYGPKCPLNQCGTCVDIERHDMWSKKWT